MIFIYKCICVLAKEKKQRKVRFKDLIWNFIYYNETVYFIMFILQAFL